MKKEDNRKNKRCIWIWIDTRTGDCFETNNLDEMAKKVGYNNLKYMSMHDLLNSKRYLNSPYRFWAHAEVIEH